MTRTRIPLLLRHRWIALLEWGAWQCHPLAVVLDPTIADPICGGCRAVIDFEDLARREQYNTPEGLQLRLDLCYAELVTKHVRAKRDKERQENAA